MASSLSKYLHCRQLRLWMLSPHVKLQLKNNQKARVVFFYCQSHVMHYSERTTPRIHRNHFHLTGKLRTTSTNTTHSVLITPMQTISELIN